MKPLRTRWVGVIFVISVYFGYFLLDRETTRDLQFTSHGAPEGFRQLVLDKRTSVSGDPILGVKISDRPGDREDQHRLGEINVCEELFRNPASPTVGDRDAKITIVEFFDSRCPYCKTLVEILGELQTEYGVRIVYKEWPILGESSELAARAALAAHQQGQYLETHTRLMDSGFIPSIGYIEYLAAELGMDQLQLDRDMASDETTRALKRTSDLAKELGFFGTPSLIIGRTIVHGAITRSELESLIEIEAASEGPIMC